MTLWRPSTRRPWQPKEILRHLPRPPRRIRFHLFFFFFFFVVVVTVIVFLILFIFFFVVIVLKSAEPS